MPYYNRETRAERNARWQAAQYARQFEARRDFWPARWPMHEIRPRIQGPQRWHSYWWYLKQLHKARYPAQHYRNEL